MNLEVNYYLRCIYYIMLKIQSQYFFYERLMSKIGKF